MRSLEIRDTMLMKQDPAGAMAASDPMTGAGAALSNIPTGQTPAQPPQTNTKAFLDTLAGQLGEMGAHLGSWPATIAILQQNGMSTDSLATVTNAIQELQARMIQTQRAVSLLMEDPDVRTLMNYDAPVGTPNMTNAMPPVMGMGTGMGSLDSMMGGGM
tara:strand:- start:16497 stop:16973 length:477 start_codon:yes stop_codon:yes gene_type:complete